jgi:succinate dehydrogenase / fumarate reductase cytochrome b subunit
MALRQPSARPLSPHLQVYSFMLTMALSIVHRMTGAGLYFGSLLLVYYVYAVAMGPEAYATAMELFGSWPGLVVLFGLTWAVVHHSLGGLRHLVWDTGRGFGLGTIETTARLLMVASIVITLAIWVSAYALGVK